MTETTISETTAIKDPFKNNELAEKREKMAKTYVEDMQRVATDTSEKKLSTKEYLEEMQKVATKHRPFSSGSKETRQAYKGAVAGEPFADKTKI